MEKYIEGSYIVESSRVVAYIWSDIGDPILSL